jgi:hypothetical protein
MSIGLRNLLGGFIGILVWIFFFVPNPIFNFLNIQGLHAHIPVFVLFGLIPVALSLVVTLLLSGTETTQITISLGVPVLGAVLCLLLWGTGVYSDEGLLGAWLYSLPPVVAYLIGIVVGMWFRRSRRRASNKDLPIVG